MKLKAPFPWFGGKSKAAHLVWSRFGDVPNYVEPFAGSLAVMLARPHEPRTETVNDLDCYVANFWRALTLAPDDVAAFADWPVNEADLHARHKWLVGRSEFRERMKSDPDYYDARIAGWWVWGICQWIGSGWCSNPEWEGRTLPQRSERGINRGELWKKRPDLRRGGKGVTGTRIDRRLPAIGGDGSGSGKGVHSFTLTRCCDSRMGQWQTRPMLTSDGVGVHSSGVRENMLCYMRALQDRLRRVRVCCGDWKRVLGPSPTTCVGVTGVLLDPPYSADSERDPSIYSEEDLSVAHDVRAWAIEHGEDPKMRIALCGYEGEHAMPANWECVPWKANGGYGNQTNGRGRKNAGRERIWFSPHCRAGVDQEFSFAEKVH
jgi:hypothetical protein